MRDRPDSPGPNNSAIPEFALKGEQRTGNGDERSEAADEGYKLLVEWREGQNRSGQVLVRRHYDSIFRFFYARASESAASDLSQGIFENLMADALR